MQRRRRQSIAAGLLLSFLPAVAVLPARADIPHGPVAATPGQWLPEGAETGALFTDRPEERSRIVAAGGQRSWLVQLGRLAFRSPLTLGGKAARAGLSCDSCHPAGGSNTRFFIPGLSDRPGNVDVTNTLFGDGVEDHLFNPINIPSLAGAAFSAPYGRDGRFASLRDFTTHALNREFSALDTDPLILDALVAYQQDLDLPPTPDAMADGGGGGAAALFASRCARCHRPDSAFLDRQSHDIGSGGLFDTPTLLGWQASAPYLHDGRAATLEQAIAAHISLGPLSAEQVAVLAGYLRAFPAPAHTAIMPLRQALKDIAAFAKLVKLPLDREHARRAHLITQMVRVEIGRLRRHPALASGDKAPGRKIAPPVIGDRDLLKLARIMRRTGTLAEAGQYRQARQSLDRFLAELEKISKRIP